MEYVLWIVAAILLIVGVVAVVRGSIGYGFGMIVVGLLVGPGAASAIT